MLKLKNQKDINTSPALRSDNGYILVHGPLSNDVRHDTIDYYYCGNCRTTLGKVEDIHEELKVCPECKAKIDWSKDPIWFAEAWDWYNDPNYYI